MRLLHKFFNPLAERGIPIRIPTEEVKAETHPVIGEIEISE